MPLYQLCPTQDHNIVVTGISALMILCLLRRLSMPMPGVQAADASAHFVTGVLMMVHAKSVTRLRSETQVCCWQTGIKAMARSRVL